MKLFDPNTPPQEGNLRVWHIPQIPGKPFRVSVDSLEEAQAVQDLLADYDLFQFEHRIKPDFCNVSGIQRYEDVGVGDFEWTDVDLEWELDNA